MKRVSACTFLGVILIVILGCTARLTREEKELLGSLDSIQTFKRHLTELAEEDKTEKEKEIEFNMIKVVWALGGFRRHTKGYYPSGARVWTLDVRHAMKVSSAATDTYTVVSLMSEELENPYGKGLPALHVSKEDPPEWSILLLGQVIWVPLEVQGPAARGYKIYGAGRTGLLHTVRTSEEPKPSWEE